MKHSSMFGALGAVAICAALATPVLAQSSAQQNSQGMSPSTSASPMIKSKSTTHRGVNGTTRGSGASAQQRPMAGETKQSVTKGGSQSGSSHQQLPMRNTGTNVNKAGSNSGASDQQLPMDSSSGH